MPRILPFPTQTEAPMADPDDVTMSEEETAAWRDLDVVDTQAYDDTFFADLASDIESAVEDDVVVPLRWRAVVGVLGAAAAALALAFLMQPAVESAPGPDLGVDESLIAAARAVGQAAHASLFDEQLDSALYASVDWLDVQDDDFGTYGSLLDELDELPGDELRDLFTPL